MIRTSYEQKIDFLSIVNLFEDYFLNMNKKINTFRLRNRGGRDHGRIIMPRRGNQNKRLYKSIDFKRLLLPKIFGLVVNLFIIQIDLLIQPNYAIP